MNRYCITAARPKNAQHYLKSEFKLWKYEQRPEGPRWVLQGWKRTARIAALLDAGDEVLTAKQGTNGIKLGDAVEVELRIAHNGEKQDQRYARRMMRPVMPVRRLNEKHPR